MTPEAEAIARSITVCGIGPEGGAAWVCDDDPAVGMEFGTVGAVFGVEAMETRELYSGTARCGGIVLSAYPLKPWFGLSVWLEMTGLGSSVGAGEGRTAWFLEASNTAGWSNLGIIGVLSRGPVLPSFADGAPRGACSFLGRPRLRGTTSDTRMRLDVVGAASVIHE